MKSTLLLAIAWGAALVLKKRSAATQHMVRTFALAALLLLPFSVMVLPAWHIKGLPQYPKSRPATQQTDAQIALSPSTIAPRKAPTTSLQRTGAPVATAPANARVKHAQAHVAATVDTQPAASVNASTVTLNSYTETPAEVRPSANDHRNNIFGQRSPCVSAQASAWSLDRWRLVLPCYVGA